MALLAKTRRTPLVLLAIAAATGSLLVVAGSSASAASPSIYVNAGGSSFTDSNGTTWSADTGFSGGSTYPTTSAIAGTTNQDLYRTQRYAMSGYAFTVPSGTYTVTLHLAELYWSAAGKRVFSVTAEGQPELSNIDVYAEVGKYHADDKHFTVTVTDGTLNLGFSASANYPIVNGIDIQPATTTTSPSPSPSPTTSTTSSSRKLKWSPPVLSNPTTINLTSGLTSSLKLDQTKDYIVKLPNTPFSSQNGLDIWGGHNVVLIGGEIVATGGYTSTGAFWERAGYLQGTTGTLYIEGVKFAGSGPGLTEGIDIAENYGARVVLQDIAVDTVHGSYTTNHADVIQTWAGPRELDVDGLEATTTYQGLFLLPDQHYSGPAPAVLGFDLNNIQITTSGGYAYWKDTFPLTGTNVWVTPCTSSGCKTSASQLFWPSPSDWPMGAVGTPPSSVLAAAPGTGYVSPGYM